MNNYIIAIFGIMAVLSTAVDTWVRRNVERTHRERNNVPAYQSENDSITISNTPVSNGTVCFDGDAWTYKKDRDTITLVKYNDNSICNQQ
jgi:membrane protein implicated in regulation of membrane protease activity